jgi:UDP-N-acetylmuramoyl-L-alanyl-D-glutamate--2,6-diaminopimelate ligase
VLKQKLKNLFHLIQSLIANIRYGFPARRLKIIGVTGTDGKTTTVSMIYHILKENGFKVAMISTLFAEYEGTTIDTGEHVTTPEPWDLPRILGKLHQSGAEYIVLESTSSGLDQNRLFGINYIHSIITNIGEDHLDYHKTWENYAKAKYKIVRKTKKSGYCFFNFDHESNDWLKTQSSTNRNIKWFSTKELKNIHSTNKGIGFDYNNTKFELPIIGEHNFQNSIGAIKLTNELIPIEKISSSLRTFKTPTGRMELIQSNPFTVIIDFAHTPSSLENALLSLEKIRPNEDSRIITVFSCAGDRDPKRREMGRISGGIADITIATLEDPRNENVENINSDIINYASEVGVTVYKRFKSHEQYLTESNESIQIPDRSIVSFDYTDIQNRIDAIEYAFTIAKENDIVFITGKGHEASLGIGNPVIEYPYSEHKTVDKLLNRTK